MAALHEELTDVPFKDFVSFKETKSSPNRKWHQLTRDAQSRQPATEAEALTPPGNPASPRAGDLSNVAALRGQHHLEAHPEPALPAFHRHLTSTNDTSV